MVAIFFVVVSALLAVPSVVATPQTSAANLFSRQLTGFDPSKIPSSCLTSTCETFVNKITNSNCVTLDCLCTTDIVNAIKACEQCAIDAGGITQADIDSGMQAFAQGCAQAGFPISGISTGGGSSGSSSSSGGSTAKGTQTGSTSAAASTATTAGSSTTSSPAKSDGTVLTVGVFGSFMALALGAINLA